MAANEALRCFFCDYVHLLSPHRETLFSLSLILYLSPSLTPPSFPASSPPLTFSPGGADFLEEPLSCPGHLGCFGCCQSLSPPFPSSRSGGAVPVRARICSLPSVPKPWRPCRPQLSLQGPSCLCWWPVTFLETAFPGLLRQNAAHAKRAGVVSLPFV